ncbi:hypothetical protein [Terrihabitans rhizophilus]|uniref:Uncharacterized protein n=1 Tax=Terrihabitans rhizophilus TaxID=3092662 RepID=A0ABU4RNB2_9HYPH|nr:hypothetical protein [Terrihabitans sp. PJ23]MDX6806330.1 hypothetical protein [Terrihabitans sp. PJ23]
MALRLTIRGNGLERFDEAVEILGENKARNGYRRALNEAGRDTKTATGRALAKQTGLKVKTTRKALRESKASSGTLEYKLTGSGGDISLKHFGARETRGGVSAAPFGRREVYDGTFMKGGKFPNRKDIGKGGHVFERTSFGRLPIRKVKSGVIIPREMVKGTTAETFQRIGSTKLDEKIAKHLKLITKGVLS